MLSRLERLGIRVSDTARRDMAEVERIVDRAGLQIVDTNEGTIVARRVGKTDAAVMVSAAGGSGGVGTTTGQFWPISTEGPVLARDRVYYVTTGGYDLHVESAIARGVICGKRWIFGPMAGSIGLAVEHSTPSKEFQRACAELFARLILGEEE